MIFQRIIRFILCLFHKTKLINFEAIDFSERVVLMPNHVSFLDGAFLYAMLPLDTVFVANTKIAHKYKWSQKFTNFIYVDQLNPFSIRQMIRVVESGKPIVIFPEGRIWNTGSLMKIYSTPGFVAMRAKAKIYPVILKGLERSRFSYLRKKNNTKLFPDVTISIGNPVVIEQDKSLSSKQMKDKIARMTLSMFQEQLFKTDFKEDVNLYNELLHAGKEFGHKSIVIEDFSSELTIKDLIVKSSVLGLALHEKLSQANRVGVFLPTAPAFVVLLFGLFKFDYSPALLNYSMGANTLVDCCITADLKQVITSRAFVEKGKMEDRIAAMAAHVEIIYLEDFRPSITLKHKLVGFLSYLLNRKSKATRNELLLYTSGSENRPKGVVLTHTNIFANLKQARVKLDLTQRDKFFNALPIFHSFGLTAGTLLPILHGICTYLYPSPLHYRVIPEMIYAHDCTVLLGTSTFLKNWGKAAHSLDFQTVRYILAGAEQVKKDVRDMYMEKFKCGIYEGYGTTEASPFISCNVPSQTKDGSVGVIFPGMEYKLQPVEGITDGGELLVKGPNMMKGYLLYEEGFKPLEDWYHTGDIVSVDEDGFIHIKARLKRFAKVAGEMVSLQLAESVAGRCIESPEVAAVAVGDKRKGEQIVICTTVPDVSIKQLREYISNQQLSPLLVPSRVIQVQAIPLLGSGKTDYVSLTATVKATLDPGGIS